MTRIETVLPRASQKLTGGYTLKESDMGRNDLTNTITASAGALMKSQTLDAPTVEAVNYDFEPSMTLSNAPDESNTYNIGDTVEFETHVQNSGNQTLRNVEVSEMTEGVSMVDGEGYELVDGKAVFEQIAPKESASAKSEYVSKEGDDTKEDWVNTAQIKMPGTGGGIAEIIKTAQSPVVIFKVQDIGKMTWAQVKQAAQDARSNPEQYYGMLGTYKKLKVPKFSYSEPNGSETEYFEYEADVCLVEIAPILSVGGVGFVLMLRYNGPVWETNTYSGNAQNLYYGGSYVCNSIFNSKSSAWFNNLNSAPENAGFVDGLMQINFKAVNSVGFTDGGVSPALKIQGVASLSGYAVLPSFLEIFSVTDGAMKEHKDSYNEALANPYVLNASFTADDIANNSYFKQASMGYMKNVYLSMEMFQKGQNSFVMRDVFVVNHFQETIKNKVYHNYNSVYSHVFDSPKGDDVNFTAGFYSSNLGGYADPVSSPNLNTYVQNNLFYFVFM